MKRLLVLCLLALLGVSCSESENDVIDFSQMPIDEVITSMEGVEWLIKQQKVDWDGLVADAAKGTFHNEPAMHDWVYLADEWIERRWVDGPIAVAKVIVVMDDNTYRHCYSPMPAGDGAKDIYRECSYAVDPETRVVEITDGASKKSVKILYYSDGVGLAEVHFNSGSIVRMNLRFHDDREEMLKKYIDPTMSI
ncbi:MAG: hypothetical protein IJ477_01155 [Alistipes sp.]|nr:hypothetical protein [Alistipes sp.]